MRRMRGELIAGCVIALFAPPCCRYGLISGPDTPARAPRTMPRQSSNIRSCNADEALPCGPEALASRHLGDIDEHHGFVPLWHLEVRVRRAVHDHDELPLLD